jgi:uncharacterized protein YjbJ (UPF0337 family)
MNAQSEEVTGHIKEIAGLMADDPDLKKEGSKQRRAAVVQGKVEEVRDVLAGVVDGAQDKVNDAIDKAKNSLSSK